MKRMRKWLLCPLIVVALLLCAIPAYAADIPTIPHAFYGTLTISGSPAPVGTVVTAKVNSVDCGSITTTVAGQYGGSGAFDEKLVVSGDIENGATIYFYAGSDVAAEPYAFNAGAVTELNLTVTPTTDTTPPSVTINGIETTTDSTPTFTGTATDTQSVISSVEYQVDSGTWTAASAADGAFDETSEDYTFTTAALSDGEHTVNVRATDAEANTTLEANYATDTFTVDATAPTVSSTSPSDGATDVALTTVVTATFSEAMDESTITTGSFTLLAGATPVSGIVSYASGTYTATFTPDANLAESTEYTASLSTAITDSAGNPLGATYSWSFTTGTGLDITPPSVTINGIETTPDTTPTFTGTATDTQSAISLVEYQVDGGSWTAATASDGAFDETSEDYTFTTAALAEGEHTVNVRATDASANTTLEADYATDTFTVDTSAVVAGDANGDGVVNALDITKVERIIAGLDEETVGADANEDGVVNALDITKVEIIIASA